MNKTRRAALLKIAERVRVLSEDLKSLKSEEEDYLDNMPENLQGSEQYDVGDNAVTCIESAMEAIDQAADDIEAAAE